MRLAASSALLTSQSYPNGPNHVPCLRP
jgi:hypothetical protein